MIEYSIEFTKLEWNGDNTLQEDTTVNDKAQNQNVEAKN